MSRAAKNVVALLASQLATWCVTLVVLIEIPKRLGDKEFGKFTYVVGYVGFFVLVAGLGSSTLISRSVARDHSLVGPYVFNAAGMKIVMSSMLSVIALAFAAFVLDNRGDTLLLIAIGCVGMYFGTMNEVFAGGLAGMQRMARPAFWQTVQVYASSLVGLFVVVVLGWDVVAYGAIMTLSVLIPFVANGLTVRPYVRGHRHFDAETWRFMVRGGVPLMTLVVLNMIYSTIDVPILHAMTGDEPVGWYGVALRWIGLPIFAASTIAAAYFPVFSNYAVNDRARLAPTVNRTLKYVMLITVPAAFGLGAVADDLIGFFYRDHQYDESIVLMRILAVFIPLAAMDTLLATALIAADRMRRYLYVAGLASLLNPIFTVLAVRATDRSSGNGAIGAAIVTVCTEALILGGAVWLRSPGVLDGPTAWYLARVGLAGVGMTAAVLLAGDLQLFARVAVGIVAYAVVSIALRTVDRSDVVRLRAMVSDMRGRGSAGAVEMREVDDPGPSELGVVATADVGGDLHAEPTGQDRYGGAERDGE